MDQDNVRGSVAGRACVNGRACTGLCGVMGMTVEKVINNNVISALENGREVVVMGRGIGFQIRAGMEIPKDQIEKVFRLENPDVMDQFKNLVQKLPPERLQISAEVIQYAKGVMDKKLNHNIYLTLTDHINFAIERYQKKMMFANPLLGEIRTFYREEYVIGMFAIDLIERRLGISFPVDEAASIALHIVNAEYNTRMRDTIDLTKIIHDVLQMVEEYFQIEMDPNSASYGRMVTHLRFLAHRIYSGESLEEGAGLEEFHAMIRQMYPEEYACGRKIQEFILQTYGHRVSAEEISYLSVHIRRIRFSGSEDKI